MNAYLIKKLVIRVVARKLDGGVMEPIKDNNNNTSTTDQKAYITGLEDTDEDKFIVKISRIDINQSASLP
jgi:hypothetical protein